MPDWTRMFSYKKNIYHCKDEATDHIKKKKKKKREKKYKPQSKLKKKKKCEKYYMPLSKLKYELPHKKMQNEKHF